MRFSIKNETGFPDDAVFWAIIGQDASGNFLHVLSDGTLQPVSVNDNTHTIELCNLNASYANYFYSVHDCPSITVSDSAYINSGRIYVSLNEYLPIQVHGPSALQFPSVTNACVPGYYTIWEFVEFAYNIPSPMLFFNTSSVDFMGIPITAVLTSADSPTTQTVGFRSSRAELIRAFQSCEDSNFSALVIPAAGADLTAPALRILSPEHAGSTVPELPASVVAYFNSFFDDYIGRCWSHYQTNTLTLQIVAGDPSTIYTGQVDSGGNFNFYAGDTVNVGPSVCTIPQPTTMDVLNCYGPFVAGGAAALNIEKFIAAAMNRTVLMNYPPGPAPSWCSQVSNYYTKAPVEYYSRILHEHSLDNLCYGFAYDDVCSQSSSIQSSSAQELTLILPPVL